MRRGEIAATYATLIHQWLTEHHFDLAHRLAPEIFPETTEQRWRSILDKHARTDLFRLVLVPTTMGIVERESQLKSVDTTIRLGERFCFELDSETDGYAIALQGVRGQWHTIPLGPNGETSAAIKKGQNRMPKMDDGRIDPLSENGDDGLHAFVLITAPTPDIPTDINSIITWIADNPCELHNSKIMVVK